MAPASGSNSVWKVHDPHSMMYVICRDIVVADVLKDGSVGAVVLADLLRSSIPDYTCSNMHSPYEEVRDSIIHCCVL